MALLALPDESKPLLPYNWRNNDDYQYTHRITRLQWAWEFLRRNPEYQKEWLNAARQRAEELRQRKKRNPRISLKISDILESGEALVNWGINQYVNPATHNLGFKALTAGMCLFPTHSQLISGSDQITPITPRRGIQVDIENFDVTRHVLAILDIKLPLGPQIKNITARSKIRQEKLLGVTLKQGRRNTDPFRLYIRHLDALADVTATPSEIQEILYHNFASAQTTFHQNEIAAKELRDGGYRELLFSSQ